MNKIKKHFGLWEKCFNIFIHFSIISILAFLICPELIPVERWYLVPYVFLCISLFFYVISMDLKKKTIEIFSEICHYKWIILPLIIYIIYDLINVLYADDKSYLINKYLIEIKYLLISILIIFYVLVDNKIDTRIKKIKAVMMDMAVVGILSAFLGIFGFYTATFTVSERLISTIPDYNIYATMMLIGFVCSCGLIVNSKYGILFKILMFSIVAVVICPTIILTNSRRTGILLFAFLVITVMYIGYWICKLVIKKYIKIAIKPIFICAIIAILAISSVYMQFYSFNNLGQGYFAITTDSNVSGNSKANVNRSKEIGERLITSISTGAFGVRYMIWDIAIDEILHFNLKSHLIGKGASYSSDLYDDKSDKDVKNLRSYYETPLNGEDEIKLDNHWMNPHNFILNDYLEGGLIKVVLLFSVALTIAMGICSLLLKKTRYSFTILYIFFIILCGLMISAKFGLLGNRWFYIIYPIFFSYVVSNSNDKVGENYFRS